MAAVHGSAAVAITNLSPSEDAATSRLVSLQEAVDFFEQAGWKVKPRTLKKYAVDLGVRIVRKGRADYAAWDDLLDVEFATSPPS
ncbi:hypothetical protein AB0454_22700 [Streptomyces sp. NPDC093509]|uniref:hypothetical protein n=1 Tax=Streptomyces sp. NPDC093509 TaxID=3154982 RepID=UPI00344B6816